MKYIYYMLMAGIIVLMAACGSHVRNHETTPEGKNHIMCGAYSSMRNVSSDELAMFRQVTDTLNLKLKPQQVATQVVAGINYKFVCKYTDKVQATSGTCIVVIYKPLQGNPSLTSLQKD